VAALLTLAMADVFVGLSSVVGVLGAGGVATAVSVAGWFWPGRDTEPDVDMTVARGFTSP